MYITAKCRILVAANLQKLEGQRNCAVVPLELHTFGKEASKLSVMVQMIWKVAMFD